MKATLCFFNLLAIALFFCPSWAVFILGLLGANACAVMELYATQHERAERQLIDKEKIKNTTRFKRGKL